MSPAMDILAWFFGLFGCVAVSSGASKSSLVSPSTRLWQHEQQKIDRRHCPSRVAISRFLLKIIKFRMPSEGCITKYATISNCRFHILCTLHKMLAIISNKCVDKNARANRIPWYATARDLEFTEDGFFNDIRLENRL